MAPDPAVSEAFDRRRALGAYYTPTDAAHAMAAWALAGDGNRVLEPSVGQGVFLDALAAAAGATVLDEIDVTGVEIDAEVAARSTGVPRPGLRLTPLTQDFLTVEPSPHDAVIGNPPYVRLRNLPPHEREQALRVAARWLGGSEMDPSGSTWMPFVLHSAQFLRPGGRMALVLPYEFTYVRYARPLWEFLGARFGSLSVVRTFERLFPDLLQDVVLLFASEQGRSTSTVDFTACERFEDLVEARHGVHERLAISDITSGRPFVSALLPRELRDLLDEPLASATQPARDVLTFRIGYVAGDKDFFHPDDEAVAAFDLPSTSLRPTVANARRLRGQGLWTSALGPPAATDLFLPDPDVLTPADRRYLEEGVARGVPDRYKCRIRDPWYVVPQVRIPQVILTVFSDTPLLLANDGGVAASNSLLCGYAGGDLKVLASQWYTSLTLLFAELQVHALGGGVFVLVPREAGAIRIARPDVVQHVDLAAVHRALLRGDTAAAYRAGDEAVLASGGLAGEDLELVRAGVAELARWRRSAV